MIKKTQDTNFPNRRVTGTMVPKTYHGELPSITKRKIIPKNRMEDEYRLQTKVDNSRNRRNKTSHLQQNRSQAKKHERILSSNQE